MRLIDANTLKAEFTGNFQSEYSTAEIHALIDLAPTVGGWISVKDHPPEKDEDVIIYGYYVGPSGETYPTTIISDIEEFKGCECVPIAWMPLPEPPKGDS